MMQTGGTSVDPIWNGWLVLSPRLLNEAQRRIANAVEAATSTRTAHDSSLPHYPLSLSLLIYTTTLFQAPSFFSVINSSVEFPLCSTVSAKMAVGGQIAKHLLRRGLEQYPAAAEFSYDGQTMKAGGERPVLHIPPGAIIGAAIVAIITLVIVASVSHHMLFLRTATDSNRLTTPSVKSWHLLP